MLVSMQEAGRGGSMEDRFHEPRYPLFSPSFDMSFSTDERINVALISETGVVTVAFCRREFKKGETS
jgi:hypothetical protein